MYDKRDMFRGNVSPSLDSVVITIKTILIYTILEYENSYSIINVLEQQLQELFSIENWKLKQLRQIPTRNAVKLHTIAHKRRMVQMPTNMLLVQFQENWHSLINNCVI